MESETLESPSNPPKQWFPTMGRDIQRGREPFLEGWRVDIFLYKVYFIAFIRISDGVVGL